MSPSSRRPRPRNASFSHDPSSRAGAAKGARSGRVRIIGGEFRGRRLEVSAVAGLRPTGDRVRETLFNWLQPVLPQSRCLDLFAGSGALGFEALSRGASHVTLVEPDGRAQDALAQSAALLNVNDRTHRLTETAEAFLAANEARFDIVFVDPPFEMACQRAILDALIVSHLATGARIYVESPARQAWEENLPDGVELLRERRFGDVVARLLGVS